MGAGSYCGQALVQADVDVAAIRGDSELLDIVQEHVCPSFGACPSMGTACTMQILGEALNLVLPGTSTIPAADNLKLRSASGPSLYRRAGPARHMPGRFNEPGGSFQYSDAGSGP